MEKSPSILQHCQTSLTCLVWGVTGAGAEWGVVPLGPHLLALAGGHHAAEGEAGGLGWRWSLKRRLKEGLRRLSQGTGRPSLITWASTTQFHITYRGVNACLACLKCESSSSCFQPGESPSRCLLRDYEPSDGTFWSTRNYSAQDPRWWKVKPGILAY